MNNISGVRMKEKQKGRLSVIHLKKHLLANKPLLPPSRVSVDQRLASSTCRLNLVRQLFLEIKFYWTVAQLIFLPIVSG